MNIPCRTDMAATETYSYYASLGVALVLGFLLQFIHLEKIFSAAISSLSKQSARRNGKQQELEVNGSMLLTNHDLSNQTGVRKKYPRSWWTDQKQFELERRAIFSKACSSYD